MVDRGQEDDRDVPGALAALDVGGGLETVHPRHLDVQQDHREIVGEQRLERLLAGGRPYQRLVQRREDRLQCQEVLRPVVDQEDLRLLHYDAPSCRLPTWGRHPRTAHHYPGHASRTPSPGTSLRRVRIRSGAQPVHRRTLTSESSLGHCSQRSVTLPRSRPSPPANRPPTGVNPGAYSGIHAPAIRRGRTRPSAGPGGHRTPALRTSGG